MIFLIFLPIIFNIKSFPDLSYICLGKKEENLSHKLSLVKMSLFQVIIYFILILMTRYFNKLFCYYMISLMLVSFVFHCHLLSKKQ